MKKSMDSRLTPDEPYLLGTHSAEERRLETQHLLWLGAARELWDRAGFGPGARLLDLGCGPGFATLELAERVGAGGRVLAVDESVPFIGRLNCEAKRLGFNQITTRVERVEMLRLEPASLDGAFVRWLFCFLPDPATVIDRIVNGLRPGARFVAWDFLNYAAMALLPRSPAFERVQAAVYESFASSGGDLNIGDRLPGLIAASGCRLVDLVPLVRYIRPGTSFWQWPTQFFSNFVPKLVENGFLTESERLAFEAEWRDREQDPGTFLFAPPMIGIVAEKP